MTAVSFDASSLEEADVGGVLPDIGGLLLVQAVLMSALLIAVSFFIPISSPVPLWLRLAGGTGGVALWRDMALPWSMT